MYNFYCSTVNTCSHYYLKVDGPLGGIVSTSPPGTASVPYTRQVLGSVMLIDDIAWESIVEGGG